MDPIGSIRDSRVPFETLRKGGGPLGNSAPTAAHRRRDPPRMGSDLFGEREQAAWRLNGVVSGLIRARGKGSVGETTGSKHVTSARQWSGSGSRYHFSR